ncbi:major facilitator superfamily domain-containing protein [Halteromyces radiatus]|uniref:major facilitator superfamily domain-containing protein n=1 Tax=Halteromyces radiatus TaxID=101107 RepID=UPI00221EFAC8|nr:major facilitator superfamily domain-containing protein [Halteromyces radiatus]KAI8089247.1 major facilitator superfamily domain-containing protein [Halteromyces radiatus]
MDDTMNKKETHISISSTSSSSFSIPHFTTHHVEIMNERNEDILAQEKKIVRRLDWRIMPLFCVFYFADFLDRANIGNAALAGIQTDLHLSATQFGFGISAFYITYIIFEIPSNVILKKTRASIWLSLIMLLWGIATICLAFITDFTGLVICRLILGAAQSGYIPAILYQMSLVYKPNEMSMRLAFLLTMSSLSGIVSGPLAYASSFLEGRLGLHGWQYLFILEGVPTVLLSFLSFFYLFDNIDRVTWLTEEQKTLQHMRMAESSPPSVTPITLKTFILAFSDWKLYMFSLVYCLNSICMTSLSIFLPTIIKGFGYPTLTSQLLTAPPSVVNSVFILLGGYLTDRFDFRTPVLMTGFSIMALAYTLMLVLNDAWALYGVLFIVEIGTGLIATSVVGWSSVNFPDTTVRAVAVAAVVMIGNSGGVIASFLYPSTNAPRHYFGNTFCLVCAVMAIGATGITGFLLYRANQRRASLQMEVVDEKSGKHIENIDLNYRYHY